MDTRPFPGAGLTDRSSADLTAIGSGWAAATPHDAATSAARDAFEVGGNAVDAALAAAVTLAAVYPHMCGMGGDLFALVRRPDGAVAAIVSAGAAPRGIDVAAVRARHDGAMPEHGPDTITVPGAVAGWETMHSLGALLPWSRAFAPAIDFATNGVPVSRSLAATLAEDDGRLASDPGLAAIFFPGGAPLAIGSPLLQPALAATLRALASAGPEVLYGGDVGARYASGLRSAGSAMSVDDLAAHRAAVVEPLRGRYRDLELLVAPPPSQGFVLLQILSLVEKLGLVADPLGSDAPALARVFAATAEDRDIHLADPQAMRVPATDLLSDSHLDGLAAAARPESPPAQRGTGDTISLVAVDAEGWAVSLIQSLYDAFGSGILEPSTGIVAHDRGACFTLEPGHPNELAPGKRPAHTLMPALVERRGALAAAIGTMGGEAQPQINAANLIRVFDLGMSPGEALAAPRWLAEGRRVSAESGVPAAVTGALSEDGFDVHPLGALDESAGHSNFIQASADGIFHAAADPRADGSPAAS